MRCQFQDRTRVVVGTAAIFLCLLSCAPRASAKDHQPDGAYSGMRWRLIGPFRGGRTVAVAGVPGNSEIFYFGAVCGGVWKTSDAGNVWEPIFDGQPVASIGAIAVAPSDPKTLYVGSGEADMRSDVSFGNGVYKSTDGGSTWRHLGLDDTQQIGRIVVDPHNPDRVLVAALGHGFGPNPERGVFRSTDGGKTWAKALYKDQDTGAIDLALDPNDSNIVYAALWNARRPAWSTYAAVSGPGGGIYKSVDSGATWAQISSHGLPDGPTGRIGLAVGSDHRVYAVIDCAQSGLYRSDNGGQDWKRVGPDPRIDTRGWYFSEVTVDPRNPDIVYVPNVSLYRSTDGGRVFTAFKGAPGGDDYHQLWIDPDNPDRMIVGCDQGAIVSVNGGKTWSSWYNQPTAQFYHLSTDNRFPYYVYGAQQDSGTAGAASRSDAGSLTFRDWAPVGAGESGYIFPDPDDPNIIYGGGEGGGDLLKFNRTTRQSQEISPTPPNLAAMTPDRYPWTPALAITPSPVTLYQGSQFVYESKDRGASWTKISRDLTSRADREGEGKGVIFCLAASLIRRGTIWAGSDTGLIHLTTDGGSNWSDVTPPSLTDWSIVSTIEASRFDPGTAYVAVDRHQRDDLKPYIYRTHDFGKTWTRIDSGIAGPAYVHAVREDPVRKGLLFAGTETGVYVSLDDGDHWQSLQLNLPMTSIRDCAVNGKDLIVATHGRSFWILDDISPLRQINEALAGEPVHLFEPSEAIRLRKSINRDTPLPRETPAGENPPAGAIIYYSLNMVPAGDVVLEVLDRTGKLVRRFSSSDKPPDIPDDQDFPVYWFRAEAPLSKNLGLNRFVWDLRYKTPKAVRYLYGIGAVYGSDTAREPEGPLVEPGEYKIRLTAGARTLESSLRVKRDPRVPATGEDLAKQHSLEMRIVDGLESSHDAALQVRAVRVQLRDVSKQAGDESVVRVIHSMDDQASKFASLPGDPDIWPPPAEGALKFDRLNGGFAGLLLSIESADAAPTAQQEAAFSSYDAALKRQLAAWAAVEKGPLSALNEILRAHHLPMVSVQ